MAMIENRLDQRRALRGCPDWLAAMPAATIRRAVVLGCALTWVMVIGMVVA